MNINLKDKKCLPQNNKSLNYEKSSETQNIGLELFEIEKNDFDDINKLAEDYYNHGKFIEAIALCHQAVRKQPNFAPGYKTLGNVLQSQNKIDAAIRAYLLAIKINPNFVEAIVNLGSMFYKQGRIDDAMIVYKKAIKLKPDLAAAYWNLGKVLEQEGRFYEAFFFQEKALEIQPNLVDNSQPSDRESPFKKWEYPDK